MSAEYLDGIFIIWCIYWFVVIGFRTKWCFAWVLVSSLAGWSVIKTQSSNWFWVSHKQAPPSKQHTCNYLFVLPGAFSVMHPWMVCEHDHKSICLWVWPSHRVIVSVVYTNVEALQWIQSMKKEGAKECCDQVTDLVANDRTVVSIGLASEKYIGHGMLAYTQ